jgi:hypothetical protein
MKERILTNWTFTRVFYLIAGCAIIFQSVISRQWFGVAFGGYFAAMGLFAFGCASGNCLGGNCEADPKQKPSAMVEGVEHEDIRIR